MMDYETIQRACAILSPVYDFLFDKVLSRPGGGY
jgi:hypothetical protein